MGPNIAVTFPYLSKPSVPKLNKRPKEDLFKQKKRPKKKDQKKTLRCFNRAGATLTREDNGTPHIRDVYRSRLSLMLHSTNNIFWICTYHLLCKNNFKL